ncbi:ATP-binding protein, partial [Streptomyces sp. FT05W]
MTSQRYATTAGAGSGAMPQQSGAPARELVDGDAPVVRDLRGRGPRSEEH